jgi:DedD protein
MDKKTARRIIGVLVVIALIIIMLPLMFNTGENPSPVQTAEIKAPEFPDPQNTTSLALNTAVQEGVIQKIEAPALPEKTLQTPAASLVSKPKKHRMDSEPIKLKDAQLIKPSDNPEIEIGSNGHMVEASAENTSSLAKEISADLSALKEGAWVIQMGSFKNKANAQRLTNALREKGFKAFTYETKSNGQTRVYVGPELKQVAATSLAGKIAEEMKMQGVVLSYKPLEL